MLCYVEKNKWFDLIYTVDTIISKDKVYLKQMFISMCDAFLPQNLWESRVNSNDGYRGPMFWTWYGFSKCTVVSICAFNIKNK